VLTQIDAAARNYPALFLALDDVLVAVEDGRPDGAALQRSFEDSADGFGADKALFLIVEERGPLRLRAVASRGLSAQEVSAAEGGLSVPGISASRIREALEEGATVMVQDSERIVGGVKTAALRGRPSSVLCAPVVDPRTGDVLAVLYVQNRRAFGELDRAWIEVYARALGRALAVAR
jgi:GAF domain-containing protein